MSKKSTETVSAERRKLVAGPLGPGDKWFFRSTLIAAYFSFILVALILIFLFNQALPVLQTQGFGFVFGSDWLPEQEPMVLQLAPMLWGSLAVSNYSPLPEFVRIPALVLVSQGLPTPEPTALGQ